MHPDPIVFCGHKAINYVIRIIIFFLRSKSSTKKDFPSDSISEHGQF